MVSSKCSDNLHIDFPRSAKANSFVSPVVSPCKRSQVLKSTKCLFSSVSVVLFSAVSDSDSDWDHSDLPPPPSSALSSVLWAVSGVASRQACPAPSGLTLKPTCLLRQASSASARPSHLLLHLGSCSRHHTESLSQHHQALFSARPARKHARDVSLLPSRLSPVALE
eukprot:6491877-Amphidinium_carterae.2